jgi:ABC-type uncharacterized transport system permease subunit
MIYSIYYIVTIMMQYIILYHNDVTVSKHHVIPASQASETKMAELQIYFCVNIKKM